MKRLVAEICLRALMGFLLHAAVLGKESESEFKFCTSEVDNQDCDAYCKMTYGRASLHNVPWTTGGCDKDRCECVFNEAELGPIPPFRCWADPRTWSLEERVNLAEARYQADLDKMDEREQFNLFKKAYDKHYASPYEEEMRFRIFQDNLKIIKELNDGRSVRLDTAVFGVTKFADLSKEEFDRLYGARRPAQSSRKLAKMSSKAFSKLPLKTGRNSPKAQKSPKPQKSPKASKAQKSQNLRARSLKETLGLIKKSRSSRSLEKSGSSRSLVKSGSSRSLSRSGSPSSPRRSRSFGSDKSSKKLERGSSWASRGAASDDDESRPRSRPPAARNTSYRMDNDDNNYNNDNQPPPPPPWIIGPSPRGRAIKDWRYPAHLYPRPESQGNCGCCWSFACVSAMEILWAHQEGRVEMFSKQDLIDCCSWNNGCLGGIISNGLLWLKTYGTSLAEDYPFTGETGGCKDKLAFVKIESYQTLNVGEAWAQDFVMERALETSPLSAGYPQNPLRLQFYVRGVWTPERYEFVEPTGHAVVIVGHYRDAWIIRNSWGADWGMEGHFLLRKRTLGIGFDVHKINGPLTQVFHSQPPSGSGSSSSSSSDNGGDYDYVQGVDDISRGITQLYYGRNPV